MLLAGPIGGPLGVGSGDPPGSVVGAMVGVGVGGGTRDGAGVDPGAPRNWFSIVMRLPVVVPLITTWPFVVTKPSVGASQVSVRAAGGAADGDEPEPGDADGRGTTMVIASVDESRWVTGSVATTVKSFFPARERHLDFPLPVLVGVRVVERLTRSVDRDERARASRSFEHDRLGVHGAEQVCRLGQPDGRGFDVAHELESQVADESEDDEPYQAGDQHRWRNRDAAAGRRQRTWRRSDYDALGRAHALHLVAPALEHLFGIEPEVDGVVAQEALGVDRRRQVLVGTVFQRRQVAQPDLGVALGAVQIHALALAGQLERLAKGRRRGRVDGRPVTAKASITDA